MTLRAVRRALLSVHDKANVLDFARGLSAFGVELVSTGGTRKLLADSGLAVREVSELTGFPEMLDGRVKTLHPLVHGGILFVRDNAAHAETAARHGIAPIDMVVVNLYPFEATVAKGATPEECIENIDIGGPAMVRSASKNFHDVAVVTHPSQYGEVLDEMRSYNGALTLPTRQRLAGAAFARTSAYDRAVSAWFAGQAGGEEFPSRLEIAFEKRDRLRYGENPHQPAAFYVESPTPAGSVAGATVLHGKELSYNNLLDLDSALELVREFDAPAAAVIKHNNPCGCAVGATLPEAFARAYEGDTVSAFGGVIAFNRAVDEATAMLLTEPGRFVECVVAPEFGKEAFSVLTTRPKWKASVRLLRTGPLAGAAPGLDYRRIRGGLLVQARNAGGDEASGAKVATKRAPTEEERADLAFAWKVCKHVKSNAIVLAKGGMVVGVGAGQMSRVDSTFMAIRKAGERVKGSVLASDAFFPFRDNIDAAAAAGVRAVVQPGGSVKDADSIAACDEHGLAMLMTGTRHFRH
ncbi:MAG: bifunctional phosphoribosylaminoimidazolecarboxamide formyltransferase/IMP cyclohydrolase [Gemmataceae bacterium]|nr:bifunctional phosphoribosylaminoimidazolecarboxamide formyltransferase/IMP cyclohydrolase [Gemmataceae bacterium]